MRLVYLTLVSGILLSSCSSESQQQSAQTEEAASEEAVPAEEAMEQAAPEGAEEAASFTSPSQALYEKEVEKFGNNQRFPKRINPVKTDEVRRSELHFNSIEKNYDSFFLTTLYTTEAEEETYFYATFDRNGNQIDLKRAFYRSMNSGADITFISDHDIRIRYSYQEMDVDDNGDLVEQGSPIVNYGHFHLTETGEIERTRCTVNNLRLDVVQAYAHLKDEYIDVGDEGKWITKMDIANGYLEAANGLITMAQFNTANGQIFLVQRNAADMCCSNYKLTAVKYWENEVCDITDITEKVIPAIDTASLFVNPGDYAKIKKVDLNYVIPQKGTDLKVLPNLCECQLEELFDEAPAVQSITLKWNKERGIFELPQN